MKRTFIHIEAGNDNWTPTPRELTALTNKFKRAVQRATATHTPVVATRDGVRVSVVEYDPDFVYTSGYAAPIMVTNTSQPTFNPNAPYTVTATTTGTQP